VGRGIAISGCRVLGSAGVEATCRIRIIWRLHPEHSARSDISRLEIKGGVISTQWLRLLKICGWPTW